MKTKAKTIQIKEFESIENLSEKQAELLEKFLLTNNAKNDNGFEVMGMSIKRGVKVFSAKNYVGIITLKDGTNIEILPKIYGDNIDENESRKILIEMLKSLHNFPCKNIQSSNLTTAKLPLFEIFIRMFLEETFSIVKKGLKSGYRETEENQNFLKGKLIFSEHIKSNFVHKEKFYVKYDVFDADQPENRLIKSTLAVLDKLTISLRSKQFIKTLLAIFEQVPFSNNYKIDFQRVIKDRNNKYYQTALSWSKVFLTGNSFTSFAGGEYARALLFPMDKLFENYVAKKLRQYLGGEYSISVQDKGYFLFEQPKKSFALRPDIVITHKTEGCFILDTKWKKLEADKPYYGISQDDMYQMYAYFREYTAKGRKPKNITLLYPYSNIDAVDSYVNGDLTVKVKFVKLSKREDVEESVKKLIDELAS